MLVLTKIFLFLMTFSSCSYVIEGSGTWGSWGSWGSCSASCGGGTKRRTRTCITGSNCAGSGTSTTSCNTHTCPRDGGWGVWNSWSSCSKTCGVGSKRRTRSCNNPSRIPPGKACVGSGSTSSSCNTQQCPRDGGWSTWSTWSACSTTCGRGDTTKSRTCNNPTPNASGKNCSGSTTSRATCNLITCPASPKITLEIPRFVGEQDRNVTLRCFAEGYPEQYQYSAWNHSVGNELIRDNLCYEDDNIVCSEGELMFKTVTFQDSGLYSCGASNGVKNKHGSLIQEGSSYLHVQSAPIVLQVQDAIKIKEDGPISANFQVLSEPQLEKAIFKTVLFDIEIRNTSNISVSLNEKELRYPIYGVDATIAGYVASLHIKHGSRDYVGSYKLVLKNSHSQVVHNFQMYVEERTDGVAANEQSDSTLVAGIILIILSIIIVVGTLLFFLWRRWHQRKRNENDNDERKPHSDLTKPYDALAFPGGGDSKEQKKPYSEILLNKKKNSTCYANIAAGKDNESADTSVYMNAMFDNTGTCANGIRNGAAYDNTSNIAVRRNYEESSGVENAYYGNIQTS